MKSYLNELVGTFVLGLLVSLSQGAPVGGFVLMVLIYAGASYSGAHYNPAVSFAFWFNKKLTTKKLLGYWLFQLIGGSVALLLARMLMDPPSWPAVFVAHSVATQFIIEALCTAIFIFVILRVTTPKSIQGNQYFGLVIGITLLCLSFAGQMSGASFNPALALGTALSDWQHFSSHLTNLAVYFSSQATGALLGAMLFQSLEEKE